MIPTTTAAPSATSDGGVAALTELHPDIIRTHILSRLDGQTLAAAACSSSHLHSLSADDDLWRSISTSTWPSVVDPRVSQVISTFPSRHRSLFSDSYPVLDHSPSSSPSSRSSPSSTVKKTTNLISAVDIYYKDELILSRVQETETISGWFMCSPFRVDLMDPKESVSTPIRTASGKVGDDLDNWLNHLEENLKLSWILIDPATRRAANVSSGRAVSVQRHWLTGEVQVRYAAVVAGGGGEGMEREAVSVQAEVTCWGKEGGGEVEVREVCLQVEDLEGKSLSGGESLRVLVAAMEGRRKRRKGDGEEGKRMFGEYEQMKRRWRERKQRRERILDLVCISVGVTAFVAFWSFILFR